ncbi:hypothetical protein H2248_006471 [Termitomyces sp. 'cryptogamus']|nr:hypothetical protein H2248_006471 [Termitomyces sp. 'cryptogamus']
MLSICFLLALFSTARGTLDWTTTPFNPPSLPLAVRSPYLSAWLPQGNGTALNSAWPSFWTRGSLAGWSGFIIVDGTAYNFLGAPYIGGSTPLKAVQRSSEFTATQTIFVLSAGPVDVKVTFLSPIEATDFVKQSIPFSYMAVSVIPTDGHSHVVQVYSDITAEWTSGDDTKVVNWTTSTTTDVVTHQIQLEYPSPFSEVDNHAEYGSVFYSTSNAFNTTFQSGSHDDLRIQFLNNGRLPDSRDTAFRPIEDGWPVFGLAHDLGHISGPTAPIVFSVGHVRDPVIRYTSPGGGIQARSLYFWSHFLDIHDVISFFIRDYHNALSGAMLLDSRVQRDAQKISTDYAAVVALSLRQAIGATEITISRSSDGSWNTSDVLVFQKDISRDGSVNTVDTIFATWPVFLYLNPTLGKYLLEGILRYQADESHPKGWAVHDIGENYPNATKHNDLQDKAMRIEGVSLDFTPWNFRHEFSETGNMLIMALSYAQKYRDYTQLRRYGALFDQWTPTLIDDSLITGSQVTNDDPFTGHLPNRTNLAIKGIIGIKAMSLITGILGYEDKSSTYSEVAARYVEHWQALSASSSGQHLTLNYGNSSSWGLTYNLYADKLLKLNLFPESVYKMQTEWYKTVALPFGVPLDSRLTYTKTDWQIWAAGTVTDIATRDMFIASVKKYAAAGFSDQPFGDLYDANNGTAGDFRARPVVGGHLALVS